MTEAIFSLISDRQHVTYAELSREIDGFRGDMLMLHGSDPNIVLWPWCSDEGIDALQLLLSEDRIFMHRLSDLSMMTDECPDLPRVHLPPSGGYRERHWLPVCFCDYPYQPSPQNHGSQLFTPPF